MQNICFLNASMNKCALQIRREITVTVTTKIIVYLTYLYNKHLKRTGTVLYKILMKHPGKVLFTASQFALCPASRNESSTCLIIFFSRLPSH